MNIIPRSEKCDEERESKVNSSGMVEKGSLSRVRQWAMGIREEGGFYTEQAAGTKALWQLPPEPV